MASAGQTFPSGPAEGAGLGESLSIHGSTEKLSSSAVNRVLMECLMYFGRAVFVFYPVYLTGYLGLSISWVLLCMVMATWWKKNRLWKDARIGTAIEFVDNETHVVNQELQSALQMASWVHFPDVEKVDWVNKVLEQAWPFFGMYMEKLLKENIQPAVRLSSPALKTFTFTKVHFGHVPLRITGMKAFTHEVDQREVVLDLNISYEGDVDIDTVVKEPITAGVKGLRLQGMLRVILEPLIGEAPLVGGVTFFFIRRPTLQINWTGMTNLLDSPAFSSLSEETIMDIIASLMVLPNRMCVPLIDQVKIDQMRFPLPRGVVRVHLLEARDLVAKDTYMMGLVKGKSDPYATLRVGNRHFKSKTVKEDLHPKWNEVYEFVVHEAPGQELELDLFDEDTDKDDFIGSYRLDLGEVKREKEMDQWSPLEGVQNGEVHLKLQWFSLKNDSSLLMESADGLACAMLAVYLDNASNLPKDHHEFTEHQKHGKHSKEARLVFMSLDFFLNLGLVQGEAPSIKRHFLGDSEEKQIILKGKQPTCRTCFMKLTKRTACPNTFVEFSIDNDVQKSKVIYASKDPVWEEGFTFFVHDVKKQQLSIQVKELEKKTQLGVLNLPLSRLLNTSNMTLDQRFPLERSGANSQIKLKATLRILTVEKPPPKIILNPPPQVQPQTNEGGNAPEPTPSVATPSNLFPDAQASSPSRAANSQNGLNEDYPTRRRGSFVASETWRSPSSPSNMRRYDSHSLLSDNSIASSRFDVSEGASYPEAIRNHQGSFGEINLTVRYASLRNKLIILVNSCRNLIRLSDNGTDSYVRLYLLPDQSWRHRKRTHVKRRTVNPVFNDKFEFDVSLEEAQARKLDVSVKNGKMFHSRERKDIGMVLVDFSQLDLVKGITEWFELTLPGLKKSS